MNRGKKLTNKQFWEILRENAGLYKRTAQAIQEKFGITYSRQAVRQRAEKDPEKLADIIEENKDVAEEGLMTIMRTCKNDKTRLTAIRYYLDRIAKDRGYYVKKEQDINLNGKMDTNFNLDFDPDDMTDEELEIFARWQERQQSKKQEQS